MAAKKKKTGNVLIARGDIQYTNIEDYQSAVMTQEDQTVMNRWWDEMIVMQNYRRQHESSWLRAERHFASGLEEAKDQITQNVTSQLKTVMEADPTQADIRLQTDRNILEQMIGEEGVKLPYKIEPEGKNADSTALEMSRYTLDFFINKEDVITEIIDFRWDRGKYGTGILFSGIWESRTVNNKPIDGSGIYAMEYEQEISIQYHIGLKNINVWDFWLDERATRWKDCTRCVWREKLDIEEFRARFQDKPGFKYVDSVLPVTRDFYNQEEVNKDNQIIAGPAKNVYLFHYYNSQTGEYWIIANRQFPIFVGYSVYKDSALPFELCQMFKRTDSVWGMALGEKTGMFVGYMNNIFSLALDKTYSSSNPPIVVGGGGEIDGEIYTGGGEIPIMNFNGDAGQVKQLQFDSRLDAHQTVLQMSQDQIIQNTGVNPAQYNQTLTGINPFVAGLQEQAKKAKLFLSGVLFEISLGKALTKMLTNIIRWGPQLYGEVIEKIIDGKSLNEVKNLSVKVANKVVLKHGKRIRFEDAPGEYGYFDIDKDTFKDKKGKYYDMSVRVVTPGNETLLDALKKQYFNEFMQNLQTFRVLYPNDPLPVEAQQLYEMMAEVFGFDPDQVTMNTITGKRRQEAADIIGAIQLLNPDNIDAEAEKQLTETPELAPLPSNPMQNAQNPTPF